MQTNRILAPLALVTLGFVALSGCAQPEYDLTVVSFPGSMGAELSDDQTRVSTGMEDMICTADEALSVEDTWVEDERTRGLEVVDLLNAGTALVLDIDGTISIVDPGDWGTLEPTPEPDVVPVGDDYDDAQFVGDTIVTLRDCEIEGAGRSLKLPAPCEGASLHEGNGTLLVWHSDGTVYEAHPEQLIAWTNAKDLSWDGVNGQFLVLNDHTVEGWVNAAPRWSTELPVQGLDVFPFHAGVGVRDVDGFLWSMTASGRDLKPLDQSIGTDGDVVGSVGKNQLAIYTDGLYVLPL